MSNERGNDPGTISARTVAAALWVVWAAKCSPTLERNWLFRINCKK